MYPVLYRVLVGSVFELCQDLKVSVHTQNINDNLNMYINDHLRMYTSDYALI